MAQVHHVRVDPRGTVGARGARRFELAGGVAEPAAGVASDAVTSSYVMDAPASRVVVIALPALVTGLVVTIAVRSIRAATVG